MCDLVDKIKYYLAHESEREAIAKAMASRPASKGMDMTNGYWILRRYW